MKIVGYLFSILLMYGVSHFSVADNFSLADLPSYSKRYDENTDPFKDAVAAIKLAQQTKRNILIEIGGEWCAWCHKMDAFLAENPDVYQKLHQNFVLLKVSVSDTNENSEFMKSLPPVLGYPHMYVSTGEGKMLLSKDTAELLEASEYSRQAWLTFLDDWQLKNNSANIAKLAPKVTTE